MLISYNEACAMNCSSLEEDLELCEKNGFDYIEIRIDMLQKYLEAHTVEELKEFFNYSHIKPHAFNALYLYPEFLSEKDIPDKKEELMNELKLCCEVGKEIGSHYIIVVPPLQRDPNGGPYIGSRQETYHNCVRILKKLTEYVKDYDMNLCFELVGFDRSSVRSIEEANAIVEAVDADNLGFVFDSYNIYLNGGCNDFTNLHTVQKQKIFAIHLMSGDEVPEKERGQDKRCFCGSGVVDTDGFLKTLKEIGYEGMISVETFRPEYWSKTPEWVIENAFLTTKNALVKNHCI